MMLPMGAVDTGFGSGNRRLRDANRGREHDLRNMLRRSSSLRRAGQHEPLPMTTEPAMPVAARRASPNLLLEIERRKAAGKVETAYFRVAR